MGDAPRRRVEVREGHVGCVEAKRELAHSKSGNSF